jgi:hypothetical protein
MLRDILALFDGAHTPAQEAAVQEQVLDIMQRMQAQPHVCPSLPSHDNQHPLSF